MWMNEYEIEEAQRTYRNHPVLGPATQTLGNLVDAVNRNSDGWPYWNAPAKAAKKLMELIDGDQSLSGSERYHARFDGREDATPEKLRKAYTPLKAFCTRHKIQVELVTELPLTMFGV